MNSRTISASATNTDFAQQSTTKSAAEVVTTRAPLIEDAATVAALVRAAGALEPNTTYAYVLLCSHFSGTSAVAEVGQSLVGCALGYRIPERPDTLFLWQVGVASALRGRGVARQLLDQLASRPALADIQFWEMSIAPSNAASLRLFQSWASRRGVSLELAGRFEPSVFGAESAHEREDVFRIGPLRRKP